jgi:hypothetical protein
MTSDVSSPEPDFACPPSCQPASGGPEIPLETIGEGVPQVTAPARFVITTTKQDDGRWLAEVRIQDVPQAGVVAVAVSVDGDLAVRTAKAETLKLAAAGLDPETIAKVVSAGELPPKIEALFTLGGAP